MSIVLVTGGTGVLGRHVVDRLRVRGHEVRVLSRHAGAGTHVGELRSGAGLLEAAEGAEVIVHLASDFRARGKPDPMQTRQVLAAAGQGAHVIYLSIVGVDTIPLTYYRRKLACERLVDGSVVPHTILRATQFHDLIAWGLRSVERLPVAPLPADFRFQPVAVEDVANRVADLVAGPPLGRAADFGGPQVLSLAELARIWREARGGPRRIVRIPLPGRVARGYRAGENTCPDHADGTRTWAEYVASEPEPAYRLRG